jgi:hypothetical protein
MLRILLFIFLGYLLFQFIFRFLIPVIRTTRQVKRGFREMNSRMNEFMSQQGTQSSEPAKPQADKKEKSQAGDYIDFEEIK